MTEEKLPIGLQALCAMMELQYSELTIDNMVTLGQLIDTPLKLYGEIVEFLKDKPDEKTFWRWSQKKMDEYIPR